MDVWSFAFSMSAVKSGRARSRLYVTSREELSSRVLLLACLPWRVFSSRVLLLDYQPWRVSLSFWVCLFRLLLLLLNCCCCCCCWIAADADFGRFWNPPLGQTVLEGSNAHLAKPAPLDTRSGFLFEAKKTLSDDDIKKRNSALRRCLAQSRNSTGVSCARLCSRGIGRL